MLHIIDLQEKVPAYTLRILNAINKAGFEAYLVGGAVRDLLLERMPGDFDITTSAKPEEVLEICKTNDWSVIDNLGQNFGCVVVLLDGEPTEVTTFRGERYAEDAHKPSETWYCDSLREDLSRRDFTINAMAIDAQGNLYDYFGGLADLEAKIVRTVGNASERYQEDGLRMLRACRFVAQLGFRYEETGAACGSFGMENTPYTLNQYWKFPVERLRGLALERVRKELEKILLAPYAGKGLQLAMATGVLAGSCQVRVGGELQKVDLLPEAMHLVGLHQNPRFHIYDTWEHTLLAIDNSPCDLTIRWALVLHDLGKGLAGVRRLNKEGQPSDPGHEVESARLGEVILQRFGYPKKFVKLVTWLVAKHMRFAPMLVTGEKPLLRWVRGEAQSGNFRISEQMAEAFELLLEVFLADMGATHARENSQLMADGRMLGEQVVALARKMPIATSDLAISGKTLLEFIPKSEIKYVYANLLERVQSGNLANEYDVLLMAVQKRSSKKIL